MGVAEDLSEIRTDKLVTEIHAKSSELRRETESLRAENALFREDALKVQVYSKVYIIINYFPRKREFLNENNITMIFIASPHGFFFRDVIIFILK